MTRLDPQLIHRLRKMAREHHLIPDMVRVILPGPSSIGVNSLDVLHYFREAFSLPLAQAKPITEWIAYDGGESSGMDLHALVWPYIEATRDVWGREGVE